MEALFTIFFRVLCVVGIVGIGLWAAHLEEKVHALEKEKEGWKTFVRGICSGAVEVVEQHIKEDHSHVVK